MVEEKEDKTDEKKEEEEDNTEGKKNETDGAAADERDDDDGVVEEEVKATTPVEVDDIEDDIEVINIVGQQPAPPDPEVAKQLAIINAIPPSTELELALFETLKRKDSQIVRLTGEVSKLKNFISKRKQTYKRKRKDEGAPTRALSAYNIFVQDRFSKLAKENELALNSADTDAALKRVPPSSLVASTGNQWKELSADDKSHYEDRAREDRKRYETQMAKYQPPDKQANRKRNKTGYNMFFSAHVLRLKQTEAGVPSERGSVARLVGNAWKALSAEEKQYYEREADKMNGMNPVETNEEEEDEETKRAAAVTEYPQTYQPHPGEMHMHPGMPPPMHAAHAMHQPDPRQHAHYYPPPHMPYGQPYHGYHEQAAQGTHAHAYHQGRHAYHQGYAPPAGHRHPYHQPHHDQRGM
mmetsp:Transcript_5893/g.8506  ORF Transcript_5893/g.8506 Transcript_5893/m.8506 type:complete len:411 (+) Transcript_5893:58-1290(+)